MKHRQAWRIERAEPGATGGEAQSSKLKAQGKLQGSSSSDIVTELGAWSLVSTKHPVLLADLVKVRAVRAGASDSLSSVRNGGEEALRKFGPLAMVRHPSPRPSPRSCLTGRGRRTHYLLQRSGHGLSQQLMAMAATPASVTSRPAPPCPVPLSLAPGFSRVLRERRHANHFNGFSPSARETAAAVVGRSLPNTRLNRLCENVAADVRRRMGRARNAGKSASSRRRLQGSNGVFTQSVKPGANERAAAGLEKCGSLAHPERGTAIASPRKYPPTLMELGAWSLPLSFELWALSFARRVDSASRHENSRRSFANHAPAAT